MPRQTNLLQAFAEKFKTGFFLIGTTDAEVFAPFINTDEIFVSSAAVASSEVFDHEYDASVKITPSFKTVARNILAPVVVKGVLINVPNVAITAEANEPLIS